MARGVRSRYRVTDVEGLAGLVRRIVPEAASAERRYRGNDVGRNGPEALAAARLGLSRPLVLFLASGRRGRTIPVRWLAPSTFKALEKGCRLYLSLEALAALHRCVRRPDPYRPYVAPARPSRAIAFKREENTAGRSIGLKREALVARLLALTKQRQTRDNLAAQGAVKRDLLALENARRANRDRREPQRRERLPEGAWVQITEDQADAFRATGAAGIQVVRTAEGVEWWALHLDSDRPKAPRRARPRL